LNLLLPEIKVNQTMFENQERLQELSQKAIDGAMSEADFAELATLSAAKRASRAERGALIAKMRETLRSSGITIHDLFAAADIVAVAQSAPPVTAAPAALQSKRSGAVLIQLDAGQSGVPVQYCKGQPLPNYVAKGFKALDDGNLEANLARYTTQEGRDYFATDAGRRELERLLRYINKRPTYPTKAPAQQKAEPVQAQATVLAPT
jgi:hypothetical protein